MFIAIWTNHLSFYIYFAVNTVDTKGKQNNVKKAVPI